MPLVVVGVALALLVGFVLRSDGSGEEQARVAASVEGREITRQTVIRWSRFENELREQMGLRQRTASEVEAGSLAALVRAEWIRSEASARGISIEPGQREAAVADLEGRIGLLPWAIKSALSSAHLGARDFEAHAVAEVLASEIVKRDPVASPSTRVLRRIYRAGGEKLGAPERRTFNFLLAPSEEKALEGKRALEEGQDWEAVARAYSHPDVLTALGWQEDEATRADIRQLLDPDVAREAFGVLPYRVQGPRPLEGGWLVFEVTEVEPAFKPSFRLARQAIRNRFLKRQQAIALASLKRRLAAKYADKTSCSPDFELSFC